MSALVIVPTYNERDNLAPLIAGIHAAAPQLHVLVVDDASPDGTGALAGELSRADGRVFVLHRAGKLGLGTAYLEGFAWGLARGYELLLEMDADLSHDPAHLPALLQAAEAADLVLGSRYVPGGGTRNWSLPRRLLSRGGNTYARAVLGLPQRDLTGGFKCFHRRVLEALPLGVVRSEGYGFQVEMTWRALRLGFTVVEVPIVFHERRVGQSKIDRRIVLEAMWMMWRLRREGPP